ncbi:MAG: ABC transporter permease [Cyanobacteria bacterium]|nr:ABC transporter permease [Cyanobacteriota bacterium]
MWLVVTIAVTAVTVALAVVTQLLTSSLPYPSSSEIWRVASISKAENTTDWLLSPGAYFTWREACPACAFAAYRSPSSDAVFGPPGEPRYISTMAVSPSFFRLFGAPLLMGRFFEEHESLRKTFGRVIVVSEEFWRRNLNADPSVIGSEVSVDGFELQVVGVASAAFWWPERVDVWRPLALDPSTSRLGNVQQILNVVLRTGSTTRQDAIEQNMTAASAAWSDPTLNRVALAPLQESWYGPMWATVNWLVFALAVMVISSFVNLALLGLHVKRTNATRIAVTQALGATASQSIRPFLKVYLLAILGAIPVALVFASLVLATVKGTGTIPAPQFTLITVPVLVGGIASALLSLVLLLLVTIRGADRFGIADVLRRTAGARLSPAPTSLIAFVQCLVAVVIATLAVMSIITARAQAKQHLGFQPANVDAVALSVPFRSYNTMATLAQLEQRFIAEANSNGVKEFAVTGNLPTVVTGTRSVNVSLDPTVEGPSAFGRSVSPGYFSLLGISKIAGRVFSSEDVAQNEPVAILSRSLAARLGISAESLPVQVRVRPDFGPLRTIVGIVDDVVDHERGGNDYAFYFPFAQFPVLPIFLAHRSSPGGTTNIETALARVDPAIKVVQAHSLSERVSAQLRSKAVTSAILLLLSLMSTSVMAIGVMVMAKQSLLARTRELAIRVALGASPPSAVLRMLANVGLGLGSGIIAGAFASMAILSLVRAIIGSNITDAAEPAILISIGIVATVCVLAIARSAVRAATTLPANALNRQQ